ncbi:carboxypeptidase regulatory-like domain-containing protein [Micromonospora parva]|uniref:carboxypeptidase regulatory-like domain-containing protein n=1 Tax=Micromonospora parva TaxID=1464048 RepID=UPI0033CEDD1B
MEILAERTEYSQTFLNVDGSRTLEEGIEPVRVRKGSSWVPVDTALKVTAEGVVPRATVLPVVFSPGGDGVLARVRDGERELGMSWPGKLPAPVVEGDSAVYRNVLPDVDLRVTALVSGFSEVLVVRTPAAAAHPKLAAVRFGLSTKGVTVTAAEGGGLAARDGSGKKVFEAPAPLMWDSTPLPEAATSPGPDQTPTKKSDAARVGPDGAGKPSSAPGTAPKTPSSPAGTAPQGARQAVMPVKVTGGELTVVPDRKLLTDPGTKYPIFIDPSWTGGIAGGEWTSVWSKHPTSSFWKNSTALTNGGTNGSAGAGRTEDCSGCADHIIRSIFQMDTSAVRGKYILDAKFRIEQRHSWTCSPASNAKLWMTGPISSGTTWDKQPVWDGNYTAQTAANRKNGAVHGCAGPGTVEFNATAMVAHAAGANSSRLTIGLRAVSEGTLNQWKRFNHSSPKLAITYNTKPGAPSDRLSDGKACGTGANRPYVLTQTPILAVRHSDPDSSQQSLTTWFHWWPLGGARNDTDKVSQASGNPSSVSKAIPAGKLTDGGTYVWQSRTYDGSHYGDWSGTCEFTVDATPPPTPGPVTSSQYPADGAPRGGVSFAGTFNIAPPSTRAYEVKEYAYTLDSGVLTAAATVPARTTDYGASVTLFPRHDGVNVLWVWAKDHAGRFSATPATYTFSVRAGSGPAAQWEFDEATGTATDVTGHGNTVSLSGSGADRVTGRAGVGKALVLDGAQGNASTGGPVQYPHPDTGVITPVRTDSSFTVTARVRLPAIPNWHKAAVAADGARTAPFWLGYIMGANRWGFQMNEADADQSGGQNITSTAAPVIGKWTHLAGVYDGGTKTFRLYVDGVLQPGTGTVTAGFNATGPLRIGAMMYAGMLGHNWPGDIDDVRMYNFVETAARIAELAVPLQPVLTFPNGTNATVGAQMSVTFSAGGDTNVTKFRWSADNTSLANEVIASAPGGTATVSVPVGAITGERPLYVVAVDDGNRVSGRTQGSFVVKPATILSGVAIDVMTFMPVVGATVRLEPGGLQVVTGSDGGYSFSGFAPGTYTVSGVKGGRCGLSGSQQLLVDGQGVWLDLYLFPYSDDSGYTCAEQANSFTAANDTVVGLSGDNAVTAVGLPFAFPFYGQAYRSAWLDTNGLLSFTDPGGSHPYTGGSLPAPAEPNAVVAPFWDDLVVDASASVRTATTGTGANERFVVEWRNVHRKASTAQRVSFEVILAPDGTVTTNYDSLDGAVEQGAQAAVGIEAPAGADGLRYSTAEAVLASGRAIVFGRPETASPLALHDLSGTLVNAAGAAVVGARVTLDPSGMSTVTGAGGAWAFDDLVADSYAVSTVPDTRCGSRARVQVELNANLVRNLQLGPDYGGLGYACTVGASGYVAASTVIPLTGDDESTSVTLPFPMRYHGGTYSTAAVYTNGLLSFQPQDDPFGWYGFLPDGDAPNAVVAPFWEDLVADESSSIRSQLTGVAPNRSFAVEWRNMAFYDGSDRTTFELVLHEDGRIVFHYGEMTSPRQRGDAAVIGLENGSGTVAAVFSAHEPSLTSHSSITYTPAASGTITGTLTTAVTSTPVAGATVTMSTTGTTVTTGADGGYQFTNVPVGEYVLISSTSDNRCVGQSARQVVNHAGGTSDVDLSVMVDGDEFGYTCETGPQTFIPGTQIEVAPEEDEDHWQVNAPFPVKIYGESYNSVWLTWSGAVVFRHPGDLRQSQPIPTPGPNDEPEPVVAVLWDDWVVDESAAIATAARGTAPNRQWVVEWRNVHHSSDPTVRASFEVIFDEDGTMTFAYADIDPANIIERGGSATVGIQNGAGTIGFQYLHHDTLLTSGQGVVFRPSPPGTGVVSGIVSCQGAAVPGATVTTAGLAATTAPNGTYQIEDVPAGTHAITATLHAGACKGSSVESVDVGSNTQRTVDFPTTTTPAGAGYTIAEQPMVLTPVTGPALPLTGDDVYIPITLPFPTTLYGQGYANGWLDINGYLSFVDPGESHSYPDRLAEPDGYYGPDAAIYPFWHDWIVDDDAAVRAEIRGTGSNRQYVIEWHNVLSHVDDLTRVSFQLIIHETGGYSFVYADLDGTFQERGGGAVIGIENAEGTRALQYVYRQPVLRPGIGLRINPPTS